MGLRLYRQMVVYAAAMMVMAYPVGCLNCAATE